MNNLRKIINDISLQSTSKFLRQFQNITIKKINTRCNKNIYLFFKLYVKHKIE